MEAKVFSVFLFCIFLTPSTVPDIEYGLHIFGKIGGKREGRRGRKKEGKHRETQEGRVKII